MLAREVLLGDPCACGSPINELLGVVDAGVAEIVESASEARQNTYRESKKDKKVMYLIHHGINDEVLV